MDGATDGTDGGTVHEYTADSDGTGPADAVLFDAVVVRYESGNDRCTLVPRKGTSDETLNAWLTVDLAAVVELDDAR